MDSGMQSKQAAADAKGDAAQQTFKHDGSIPKPDPEKIANSTLCLIRHGTTEFNVICQDILKNHGPDSEEFRALKKRKDLIDPPLNNIGLVQCETGKGYINEVNFKVVYVSPMYRCLMTALHLFKEHPQKDKITFVVLPVVKECLHLCNDICGPYERIFEAFSDPAKCEGIAFDFSMYHLYGRQSTWQFSLVPDVEMLKKSFSTIKMDEVDEDKYGIDDSNHHYLEMVYDEFPMRVEGYNVLYWRTQIAKQFVREHLRANFPEVLQDKSLKVALVAHSSFLKSITADGVDENDEIIGGADMSNCEIYPFDKFDPVKE